MVGSHKHLMRNATEQVLAPFTLRGGSFFKPEEVWLLVQLQGPKTLRAMQRQLSAPRQSRPVLVEGTWHRLLRLEQQQVTEPLGYTAWLSSETSLTLIARSRLCLKSIFYTEGEKGSPTQNILPNPITTLSTEDWEMYLCSDPGRKTPNGVMKSTLLWIEYSTQKANFTWLPTPGYWRRT